MPVRAYVDQVSGRDLEPPPSTPTCRHSARSRSKSLIYDGACRRKGWLAAKIGLNAKEVDSYSCPRRTGRRPRGVAAVEDNPKLPTTPAAGNASAAVHRSRTLAPSEGWQAGVTDLMGDALKL